VANLPPVSTQAELVANFAAGVVDTGGKFSGAWGKMIHEKNLKQKIS
jgi:hypothetical protein